MTQIAIVVYPGYTALDFIGPYEVLRNLPDAEVRFVWHEPGPIAADSGVLLVGATHSFDETPSPDVILVPGGMTTFEHARDEKLLDWVRQAHQTATWTASVCSGSVILAAAGLLKGKRATSHWMVVPELKTFGVHRRSATSGSCTRAKHRHLRGRFGGHRPRACGWPGRSAARAAPRPSSWRSNTTRSRRSTPATCPRRRRRPRRPRPRCCRRTWSNTAQLNAVDAAALGPGAMRAARVAAAPQWRFRRAQPR